MNSRKSLSYLPLLVMPWLLALASCSRDPKVIAQRDVNNGNKFFAKGKYREAGLMYRKAIKTDLRFGEAYYRLGLTELRLSAFGDAAHSLRRAVDLQPNNTDAVVKLGNLLLLAAYSDAGHRQAYLKDIQELADKLLKADANSYDGHRLQGQIALLKGNKADALDEFKKANDVKPNTPELVMSYFQALVLSDRFPEAEKLAQDLLAKQKSYSPMYTALYVQYMRRNRPADAEQVLKLQVANNPKRANYVLELAQHYYLLNRRADMDAMIQQLSDDKKFPEGHLLAGDFFLFRAREFDRAQDQYEAGMKAFPKDKAVYQKRIVEVYASQAAKSREANQLIATILKENPKDSDAIAMRAALMLQSGNLDQIKMAAADLQGLVTKTPNNHLLRFNLARALLAKAPPEVEAARLQLEEAVKIRPDFIAARELLARIYQAKGDPAKALKAADEAIGYDRNNLQAHLIRSSALLGMGDKDKARQELAWISKAYPQSTEAKFQVGALAFMDKDYKAAEQIVSELYKNNPHDGRNLALLTEVLASQHRMGDAIAVTQKAIDNEPQRRDLKLFLANLEMRDEKYDDAITVYKGLLAQEPKSADLLFRLAETQRRKGDINASIDNFRRCSQEAPNQTNCLRMLGLIMDGTGKRDQAMPIYEQILKISPDDPVALNNLAFAKAEEGVDLDQALTMSQRAVQRAPNSPELADTLGWIYIKKSLSDQAVRIFSDLVVKYPDNPIFHYHYGIALSQKGDKAAARKEFETALNDKPSRDDEAKIRELLSKMSD